VVAREVTKVHEEFLRGRAAEVLETLKSRNEIKGEITLIIGKAGDEHAAATKPTSVRERLQELMSSEKLDEKTALKKIAKERGVSKSEAYRELQRSK
jgi:16S rRNA (cytidine1402-2'-O)-methyltransferase